MAEKRERETDRQTDRDRDREGGGREGRRERERERERERAKRREDKRRPLLIRDQWKIVFSFYLASNYSLEAFRTTGTWGPMHDLYPKNSSKDSNQNHRSQYNPLCLLSFALVYKYLSYA